MQLTFLLGNGFDKAIGLDTGYGDFYNWYQQQPDESDDIKYLKSSIKGNEKTTWADFEIALGQFTAEFDNADRFCKCFSYAKNSLIQYLTEEYNTKISTKKDFLKSATYRLIERSQNVDKDLSDENKKIFSISKAEKMIFNCVSFNYTPVFRDGWDDMTQNATGISDRDEWYHNYELGEIINVHGLLDDHPILGVDHVEQIANEAFRTNERVVQMMVKGEADKAIGAGWRSRAHNIVQKSDKIYVYGMSLGDTDMFWWMILANWLEASPSHQLAIYCHPRASEDDMSREKERVINCISRHLTNNEMRARIAIDNVEKNMIVSFVSLSANKTIRIEASANITACDKSINQ